MTLPLTKTLDLADYEQLGDHLYTVDLVHLGEQHPQRRWEYAMALLAIQRWWQSEHVPPLRALDVGGAGSPFNQILVKRGTFTTVIDPKINQSLENTASRFSESIVTCISTIEHVADDKYKAFKIALADAVKPGGLLFLTSDIWNTSGPDRAHFHWMRERIYTPESWENLALEFESNGFRLFGGYNWSYRGEQVYNYSFASMALKKRWTHE